MPERLRTLLRLKTRYDSDFDELLGYHPIPVETDDGRAKTEIIIAAFDEVLKPAPKESIFKILARLKISTGSRNQDDADARLERRVYVDELTEFPLDVIDEACRKWARREKWFPSVSEIRAECQQLVRYRRLTRDALARAVWKGKQP